MSSKVEAVLSTLTLEEKVKLLAGKDFWETVPISEKGIPAIKACGFALSHCDAPS
jgi:beta-glucosidase